MMRSNERPKQTPMKVSGLTELEGKSYVKLAKALREPQTLLFIDIFVLHQYCYRNFVVLNLLQVTDFQITILKRDEISSPSKSLIFTSDDPARRHPFGEFRKRWGPYCMMP